MNVRWLGKSLTIDTQNTASPDNTAVATIFCTVGDEDHIEDATELETTLTQVKNVVGGMQGYLVDVIVQARFEIKMQRSKRYRWIF
ncbi:unnamed protein product [Aphanomyces euteiches]